jgi:predicted nucleic acid-binding Zn ribbon protein
MTKRRRSPEAIGKILESLLAERGYLTMCKEQEVQRRWAQIVGERIAAVTECTGVEQGVVYVRVSSAAWRNELAYLKETLLAKLRAECKTIQELVLS